MSFAYFVFLFSRSSFGEVLSPLSTEMAKPGRKQSSQKRVSSILFLQRLFIFCSVVACCIHDVLIFLHLSAAQCITWPLQEGLGISQEMQWLALSQCGISSEWKFSLLFPSVAFINHKPCQSCYGYILEWIIQWTSVGVRVKMPV